MLLPLSIQSSARESLGISITTVRKIVLRTTVVRSAESTSPRRVRQPLRSQVNKRREYSLISRVIASLQGYLQPVFWLQVAPPFESRYACRFCRTPLFVQCRLSEKLKD